MQVILQTIRLSLSLSLSLSLGSTNLWMNVEMMRFVKLFALGVSVIEQEAILDSKKPTKVAQQ